MADKHVEELGELVDAVLAVERPTRVTRGSAFALKMGPSTSLSCCTSCRRASASTTMERNFTILNLRRLRPTRSCAKKMGPGVSSLMASAVRMKTGASIRGGERDDDIGHALEEQLRLVLGDGGEREDGDGVDLVEAAGGEAQGKRSAIMRTLTPKSCAR